MNPTLNADYERLVEALENFVLDVSDGWLACDPGYRVARRKALAEAFAAALTDGRDDA